MAATVLTKGMVKKQIPHITEIVEADDKGYAEYTSYHFLVECFGFDILAWEEVGSYQGDYYVLVYDRNTYLYGYQQIGYGSCSGCDWLEGVQRDYDGLNELYDHLFDNFWWGYHADMLYYFSSKTADDDWRVEDNEYRKAMGKILAVLKSRTV